MIYKVGNIVDLIESGMYDVAVHGCNCMHVMGAGVAGALVRRWPSLLDADKETSKGDVHKLGKYTGIVTLNETLILNAYTQYAPGRNLDMQALEEALVMIASRFENDRILMPKIGSGIAGGKWEDIAGMIEYTMMDMNVTICVLDIGEIPS